MAIDPTRFSRVSIGWRDSARSLADLDAADTGNVFSITGGAVLEKGDLTLSGSGSDISVAGTLWLGGAATLHSTATVSGQLTASNGFLAASGATCASTLSVGGAATLDSAARLNSTLTVSGQVTASNGLLASSGATFNSTASVGGAITAHSTASVLGQLTVTGGVLSASGLTALSTLSAGGAATLHSTLSVLGEATLSGGFKFSGSATSLNAYSTATAAVSLGAINPHESSSVVTAGLSGLTRGDTLILTLDPIYPIVAANRDIAWHCSSSSTAGEAHIWGINSTLTAVTPTANTVVRLTRFGHSGGYL